MRNLFDTVPSNFYWSSVEGLNLKLPAVMLRLFTYPYYITFLLISNDIVIASDESLLKAIERRAG